MTRLSFHRGIRLLDFVLFPPHHPHTVHRHPHRSTSSIINHQPSSLISTNTRGNEQRQAITRTTMMTNYNIFYLYVVFILHFLSFNRGFGFQSFCRLHRWGARTTQDNPHHPISPLTTTRTPSSSPSFSTILYRSRNLQLQLKETSIYLKGTSNEIKDWLQNRLDLNDKEIERIYNNANVFRPHIIDGDVASAISSRIENLDNKINVLQKRLNVTDKEISKIINQSNTLLGLSSEAIGEKLDWLKSRLDLDDKQLSTLVWKGSNILTISIEVNLSPTLTWFEKRLDLNTTQQLRTLVLKFPSILLFATESMEDKLTWYKNRFNFPDSEKAMKKIIQKATPILGLNVASVGEKLSWLQNRLDLTDVELYKICQGCPTILTSHVDNKLEPHLCFLASRFCLDQKGLRMMICKMPTILSCSIDNINSTMEFYEDILGKSEGTERIFRNPTYLSLSLEGRLKPRLANLTDLGLAVGEDVPLTTFVLFTNKRWEEYMEQLRK